MKEKSAIELFSENAAEYVTTGNKRVGKGTIVILSSVTGSTIEMVEGVKKAQTDGAKVFGFIDKAEAELAKMVDYVISYPANEQLKFFMVADRFMKNAGEFEDYDEYYAEMDAHLAQGLVYIFLRNVLLGRTALAAYKVYSQCRILPWYAGSYRQGYTCNCICR